MWKDDSDAALRMSAANKSHNKRSKCPEDKKEGFCKFIEMCMFGVKLVTTLGFLPVHKPIRINGHQNDNFKPLITYFQRYI